jgi:glycerol-3-phosphate O-acyltransferase
MKAQDRERVLTELQSRVTAEIVAGAHSGGMSVEDVLADSAFFELKRLKESRDKSKGEELAFWLEVKSALHNKGESALKQLLSRAVRRYADEICGRFDERVYDAVTRAGEPVMGMLMNAVSPRRILQSFPALPSLDDTIVLQGEVPQLKRLHERGTVVLVPTHVSHMDSIAVGYALWKLGLPPFLYGAGLNLFSNPMLGFFMRNLGAYTVDRRKQDPVYKRVLKEYATLTLENGYDNIFFPGGTRSRSGALEKKLKLGLLGTGVSAFVNNLQNHKQRPNIYIVPATLSFSLVLEAETLIDDFLKEVGKSRYIITDDEFSRPRRVYEFLTQLLSLDSKIHFTVGRALDPFGNDVDDAGNSLDPAGRTIDPQRYVFHDGAPVHDAQRDAEMTREVGERVTEAYARDFVIQSTHVTARAVMNLLRKENAGVDLMRLLRAGGRHDDVPLRDVYAETARLLTELRGMADRGAARLGPYVGGGSADDVVTDGIKHFSIYHTKRAVERKGDRVFSPDRTLLFYYANRLEGFRLERGLGLKPLLSADHRALGRGA